MRASAFHDNLGEAMRKVAAATEKELLAQLNELVSRGLLIVETQGPTLVQEAFTNEVLVRTAVRLVLKDQEYIETLERENAEMKALLEKMGQFLNVTEK